MGGFFGVVSNKESSRTLYYGTDYHSHLGTKRGGMAVTGEDGRIMAIIHDIASTQFRAKFDSHMDNLKGKCGIGVISDYDDQPLTVYSRLGTYSIVTVGKINNQEELVEDSFSTHHSGHYLAMSGGFINPTELIATLINQKTTFEEGIEYAASKIKGSMSILIMCNNALYAARDRYGRTPVFIGQFHDTTAVSMEDAAFLNLGLKMVLELGPGQIVKLTPETITELRPARKEMQICAFLWSITATPLPLTKAKTPKSSAVIAEQLCKRPDRCHLWI
jgi:amidophosphoribosyltransferase